MRSTTFCGAAAPIPTVRDILKRQENNVALNEVMFPLPRVFAEFDAVIDSDLHRLTNAGALSKSLMKVMSKNVKRFSLSMEKWVEELAMLYSIDSSNWEPATEFPWATMFFQRMISCQKLLEEGRAEKYLAAACVYKDWSQDAKKKTKSSMEYHAIHQLHSWLELHLCDTDNASTGQTPSDEILKVFDEWRNGGGREREMKRRKKMRGESPLGPHALDASGFPADCGDMVDLSNSNAERLRANSRSSFQSEDELHKTTVVIYARVKEMVVVNCKAVLVLWTTPDEEVVVQVPRDMCAPVNCIVPGLNNVLISTKWSKEAPSMRQIIQDPFSHFKRFVDNEIAVRCKKLLASLGLDVWLCDLIGHGAALSFLYYNHAVATATAKLPEELVDEYAKEFDTWSKVQQEQLMEELKGEREVSSNRLFVPTAQRDLEELATMSFCSRFKEFMAKYIRDVEAEVRRMQTEKETVLDGHMKNQLSKWWCLLIDTQCELFLTSEGFNLGACNLDNYIDEAPASLDGVKENLKLVRRVIDPHDDQHSATALVEELKSDIYPVIQEFVYKAQLVIAEGLYGSTDDVYIKDLDLEKAALFIQDHKEQLAQTHEGGPRWVTLVVEVIKDIEYLRTMQQLEQEQNKANEEGGMARLSLQSAVPVSGLVMGYFYKLENVLNTIIELWEKPVAEPAADNVKSLTRNLVLKKESRVRTRSHSDAEACMGSRTAFLDLDAKAFKSAHFDDLSLETSGAKARKRKSKLLDTLISPRGDNSKKRKTRKEDQEGAILDKVEGDSAPLPTPPRITNQRPRSKLVSRDDLVRLKVDSNARASDEVASTRESEKAAEIVSPRKKHKKHKGSKRKGEAAEELVSPRKKKKKKHRKRKKRSSDVAEDASDGGRDEGVGGNVASESLETKETEPDEVEECVRDLEKGFDLDQDEQRRLEAEIEAELALMMAEGVPELDWDGEKREEGEGEREGKDTEGEEGKGEGNDKDGEEGEGKEDDVLANVVHQPSISRRISEAEEAATVEGESQDAGFVANDVAKEAIACRGGMDGEGDGAGIDEIQEEELRRLMEEEQRLLMELGILTTGEQESIEGGGSAVVGGEARPREYSLESTTFLSHLGEAEALLRDM